MNIDFKNKWLIGVSMFVLMLFFLGPWSRRKVAEPSASSAQIYIKEGAGGEFAADILRIESRAPGTDHFDNVILVNKVEAARFKNKNGRTFDKTGRIPDGKIRFVSEFENTYGFENYAGEKLDGEFVEYYADGRIKVRAVYSNGRLKDRKIYFDHGGLFSEEDYTDTSFVRNVLEFSQLKKIGRGKVYRYDGTLKQEWSATDQDQRYYIKFFDAQGALRESQDYDKNGMLVEHWKASALESDGP